MKREALLIFLIISTLSSCSSKKSMVLSFEYGGHDTTCALLNAEIYESEMSPSHKDTLTGVANAILQAEDTTQKIYKTVATDADGRCAISICTNGKFNLIVKKDHYQTVKIKDYIADSGQVSTVKIVLEKNPLTF
jgi:hypothetical protein